MNSCDLTIALPVYNGGSLLVKALNSLLDQTYADFRLLIFDNASTDNTERVCRDFAERDARIEYRRHATNHGGLWNFNHAFTAVESKYFAWACHDDFWEPTYLKECMKGYDRYSDLVLSGTSARSIHSETNLERCVDVGTSTVHADSKSRYVAYRHLLNNKLNVNGLFYGVYLTKTLREVMPLKKEITADHILLSKLSLLGSMLTSPEVLMTKRFGGTSATRQSIAKTIGLTNPLKINAPFLMRESHLQTAILKSKHLNFHEKISIALWSLSNYINHELIRRALRSIRKLKSYKNAKSKVKHYTKVFQGQ